MRIRLLKPLPQIGRVVPAGVILDAPEGLSGRLIREGRAEIAEPVKACHSPPEPQPEAKPKRKGRGKRA